MTRQGTKVIPLHPNTEDTEMVDCTGKQNLGIEPGKEGETLEECARCDGKTMQPCDACMHYKGKLCFSSDLNRCYPSRELCLGLHMTRLYGELHDQSQLGAEA